MIRNMSVAAILKSETPEEESLMRNRIKVFAAFFLPLFCIFEIGIFTMELILLNNIDKDNNVDEIVLPIYLLMNLFTILLTSLVGVVTLTFALSLKKLI
jgi:hypothetical protein